MYKCIKCNKCISRKDNLSRHCKKSCKAGFLKIQRKDIPKTDSQSEMDIDNTEEIISNPESEVSNSQSKARPKTVQLKTFNRLLPYLKVLRNVESYIQKRTVLKALPHSVSDDIIELINKISSGKLKFRYSAQKKTFDHHERTLEEIDNLSQHADKRLFLLKRNKKFFHDVIPILISIIEKAIR